MKYVKFVDGKGGVITDFNTNLVPLVGEHVQFNDNRQGLVTRVMNIYAHAGDWVMVTVAMNEPVQNPLPHGTSL